MFFTACFWLIWIIGLVVTCGVAVISTVLATNKQYRDMLAGAYTMASMMYRASTAAAASSKAKGTSARRGPPPRPIKRAIVAVGGTKWYDVTENVLDPSTKTLADVLDAVEVVASGQGGGGGGVFDRASAKMYTCVDNDIYCLSGGASSPSEAASQSLPGERLDDNAVQEVLGKYRVLALCMKKQK